MNSYDLRYNYNKIIYYEFSKKQYNHILNIFERSNNISHIEKYPYDIWWNMQITMKLKIYLLKASPSSHLHLYEFMINGNNVGHYHLKRTNSIWDIFAYFKIKLTNEQIEQSLFELI